MNKTLAFALSISLLSPLAAAAADAPKSAAETMAPLKGTYKGYCPVDASEINIGEAEAVVDDAALTLRAATGAQVLEMRLELKDFRSLAPEKLKERVGEELAGRLVGIEAADSGYPLVLLGKDPADNQGAMNFFETPMAVMFGAQCILFTPAQVAAGHFEKDVLGPVEQKEREAGKKLFPRLQYGGTTGPAAPAGPQGTPI